MSLVFVLSALSALGVTGCGDDGCDQGNRSYESGDVWTCSDGCNSCSCHDGTISSTAIGCGAPPGPAAGKLQCLDGEWRHSGTSWDCGNACCTCDDGHVLTSSGGC